MKFDTEKDIELTGDDQFEPPLSAAPPFNQSYTLIAVDVIKHGCTSHATFVVVAVEIHYSKLLDICPLPVQYQPPASVI